MRGVEANTQSLRLANAADNVGEVLEFASQARSLAGGRFQRDPRLYFRNSRKHAVDRFDNALESGFFACAEMRARMQHQKRQFELIGAN